MPDDVVFINTKSNALAHVEAELRLRHVKARATGIIILPERTPRVPPPPEFWTQEASAMSTPIETPLQRAQRRVRAIARAMRYGAPISPEV